MASDHILDELPLYVNGTLDGEARARVDRHLTDCPICEQALEEWQQIARRVQAEGLRYRRELPPLSAAVRLSLRRPKSLAETVESALALVWVQRAIVLRGGVLASVIVSMLLGVIGTAVISRQSSLLLALPLLILIPCLAVILIAYFHDAENDVAFEIVAATATRTSALVFARLTLSLCLILVVALSGSLVLDWLGVSRFSVLVAAWMGPMLLLSGLATVLVLRIRPLTALGITMALWAGVVTLLISEASGGSRPGFTLVWMLAPSLWQIVAQVVVAAILWLLGWVLLPRDHSPRLKQVELG